MIENCEFDSHSLRQPHDFAPTYSFERFCTIAPNWPQRRSFTEEHKRQAVEVVSSMADRAAAWPLSTSLSLPKSDALCPTSSDVHAMAIVRPFVSYPSRMLQGAQGPLEIDQRAAVAAARRHDPADKDAVGADRLMLVELAFDHADRVPQHRYFEQALIP